MSPELAEQYGGQLDQPMTTENEEYIRELLLLFYGTVVGGGNLEGDSFTPRESDSNYARLDQAFHPQTIDPEDVGEFLSGLGREGMLSMLSHPEVGLMPNFEKEFIPDIEALLVESGAIEAMKTGRPVVIGPDHDNWMSTALLGVGCAQALRNLGEEELAMKTAMSMGYAAASFDKLSIMGLEFDPISAVNMHLDIIKSLPNSHIRTEVNKLSTEDNEGSDPARELAKKTKEAIDLVLSDGGLIVVAMSGTHDKEVDGKFEISEPGPGTAKSFFSDEVMEKDPLFIPCIAQCNPMKRGVVEPTKGKFKGVENFEFSAEDLDAHSRMLEFLLAIQAQKAITTRRTVRVVAHKDWQGEPTLADMTYGQAALYFSGRNFKSFAEKYGHN